MFQQIRRASSDSDLLCYACRIETGLYDAADNEPHSPPTVDPAGCHLGIHGVVGVVRVSSEEEERISFAYRHRPQHLLKLIQLLKVTTSEARATQRRCPLAARR